MSENEELTKIVLDLPNHWAAGGESMWAKPLGENLYELGRIARREAFGGSVAHQGRFVLEAREESRACGVKRLGQRLVIGSVLAVGLERRDRGADPLDRGCGRC